MRICSASSKETKQIAARLAKTISLSSSRSGALVLALEGNLCAGKTTFVQGLARALGAKENVLSPTFVLIKVYPLNTKRYALRHLIHIEWGDRLRRIIPKNAIRIKFEHGKRPGERVLRI